MSAEPTQSRAASTPPIIGYANPAAAPAAAQATPEATGAPSDALRLADAIDPLKRKQAPDHLTTACAAKALRELAQAPAAAVPPAPELLEAAVQAESLIPHLCDLDGSKAAAKVVDMLRAAIAKATGAQRWARAAAPTAQPPHTAGDSHEA